MEIYTGNSIAEQLSLMGTPCKFVNMQISPQFVKYDFVLDNILNLQKVKRIMANLSALAKTQATFCDSSIGHFAIQMERTEKETIYLSNFATALKNAPNYSICLGLDENGEQRTETLDNLTHLLVAGTTGSGKSVCLNDIIMSLICYNTPKELALVLIDTKKVEFNIYNTLPHLLFDVVSEIDTAQAVLNYLVNEMENRYKIMEQYGLDKWNGQKLVVIIDELADLILQNENGDIKSLLIRLLQKARASGIHLIIATQSPRAKILDGVMLANLPSRLCLTCANVRESVLILGHSAGEKLKGNGDSIFKNPKQIAETRLQIPFISKQDIHNILTNTKPQTQIKEAPKQRKKKQSFSDKVMELWHKLKKASK